MDSQQLVVAHAGPAIEILTEPANKKSSKKLERELSGLKA